MTPSQIESKRSIDRENQRYCRAKRKSKLDQLQQQVDALTKQLEDTRKELQASQTREKSWSETFATLRLPNDQGTESKYVENSERSSKDTSYNLASVDYNTSLASYTDSTFDIPPLDSSLSDTSWDLDIPSTPPYTLLSPSAPLPWSSHFTIPSPNPSPPWKSIPLLLSATTQLDLVILTTTDTLRRHGLRNTTNPFPSISSLLNPPGPPSSESCSISDAAAAQVRRSPLQDVLSRVGFLFVLSHLLRWYICRTEESYEQLPAFIRPTKMQLSIPHPAWIDVIIWPEVRDAIIQKMDWSRFEEYRQIVSRSLSVNWPHSDPRSILQIGDDGKSYRLSDTFERHICTPENWSVDKAAAEAFPFLESVSREDKFVSV
ncbi:hypothetical protein NW762_008893 [Fusarium torreyae]|uniref:BZIP domain-containing protein n=1 Tax=Fusarium torreyae TaxID=1237075 RepID=A0A9W8RXF7_9HYPO|nr:hypothetical protein NW762_008893 [Fusarium torreyae]